MSKSKIEWTETTWNPATGCSRISSGCQNCYAEIMARRLHAMGVEKYQKQFELAVHPEVLSEPYRWKKPRIIFVNSMSDLFHEEMPLDYIKKVFQVMNECRQHIFQVLTKRADVLEEYGKLLNWTENIWMGVTVENADCTNRIQHLQKTDAFVKFLSIEPLLGPIGNLNLNGINWVIVGGESGPKARPMEESWVREIQAQCDKSRIPFFFKQWGGKNKKAAGRELAGRTWDEMPVLNQANSLAFA